MFAMVHRSLLNQIAHSIAIRLLGLGLAIVLLGAVARYYALTHFLREDLGSVVAAQQQSLADYVAQDVNHKVSERLAFLQSLAATLPLEKLSHPGDLGPWLQERQGLLPLFSAGLLVTDRHGHFLYPPAREDGRMGLCPAPELTAAALAGTPTIGRPVRACGSREPILPMAVPIRDRQGQVVGTLMGVTALESPGFLDSLFKGRIGENGGFLLVSPRDHLFVAATQREMTLQPTPQPGVNLLHDQAMAGYRGTGVTVNAKGTEEVVGIVSVPATGWFVVARIPASEAFVTVSHVQNYIIRNGTLLVMGFVGLLSLGLFFLFRPLREVASLADRMTLGEVPMAPLPVHSKDEVGHLTAAFNRLLVKLVSSQEELAHIALHDPLTRLPNRAFLFRRIRHDLDRARLRQGRLALLFLDLDGFKEINDTLGHEAGDQALLEVARRFEGLARRSDTLARLGGDEFVLLLADLDERAETTAQDVARRCIEVLHAPFPIGGKPFRLGVSVGIALGDGQSPANVLVAAADKAMYAAKERGGNAFTLASL